MKGYEKRMAKLKQLYSVKGVKTFRGHHGYGFNATLYMGKKKVAVAVELATGGDMEFQLEDQNELEKLEIMCTKVGDVPSLVNIGEGKQEIWLIPYSISSFVFDLVEDYKENKRLNKKASK